MSPSSATQNGPMRTCDLWKHTGLQAHQDGFVDCGPGVTLRGLCEESRDASVNALASLHTRPRKQRSAACRHRQHPHANQTGGRNTASSRQLWWCAGRWHTQTLRFHVWLCLLVPLRYTNSRQAMVGRAHRAVVGTHGALLGPAIAFWGHPPKHRLSELGPRNDIHLTHTW
jgi:hypothetical protein